MENRWLTQAVLNNATLCDEIAKSHGISTEWHESVWLSEHPMPRFYPNIVTLESSSLIDRHIDSVGLLLPVGWGIKDSFGQLDLVSKGFTMAFDAHWYCCEPNHGMFDNQQEKFPVHAAKTHSELNRWVTAWGEGEGIFNSALLENDSIELLYVERDGQIVSGLVTNVSGDAVGISNAFGCSNEILCCVAAVIEQYPNNGIVGYGDKAEIEALSAAGFLAIGDLRIWLRH